MLQISVFVLRFTLIFGPQFRFLFFRGTGILIFYFRFWVKKSENRNGNFVLIMENSAILTNLGHKKIFFSKIFFSNNTFLGVFGVTKHEFDIIFLIWELCTKICQLLPRICLPFKVDVSFWAFWIVKLAFVGYIYSHWIWIWHVFC